MNVDMSNPVPDVGERVVYRGDHYRVDAWIREENGRRVSWGNRSEATKLCIVGVCGFVVLVGEVQRTGQYVDWSDEVLLEHQEYAASRAGTFNIV